MAMLDPKSAVLDETDSGLDVDALQIVSNGVNALRGPALASPSSPLSRLLDYIVPDRVPSWWRAASSAAAARAAHQLDKEG